MNRKNTPNSRTHHLLTFTSQLVEYSRPFILCFTIILASLSYAQSFEEVLKAVASNRSTGDNYGYAVDISGDYAIIGARNESEDANGLNTLSDAGGAYIFERNSSGDWVQVEKIVASDRAVDDNFGFSVAIDGNFAIVGAPSEDEDVNGNTTISNSGSAYIFQRNGSGSWSQIKKLGGQHRSTNDNLGFSVDISGDYAIVGAWRENAGPAGGNIKDQAGSAFVYVKGSSNTWNLLQKLTAPDRDIFDNFGTSVSISGNQLVVGAYRANRDEAGNNFLGGAGAAYIYLKSGSTYGFVKKLVPSDRLVDDYYGWSVSISGNYVAVGAYQEDEDEDDLNALEKSGSVYLYENSGGTQWAEVQKIVASDRAESDYFGYAVAVSGDKVVVGAYNEDEDATGGNTLSSAGSSYIFERNSSGTWSQIQKVVSSDRQSPDYFGSAVALSDDYMLVGARLEDDGGFFAYGAAYFFEFSSNSAPTNIALSSTSINENNSVDAVVGTLTTTDANAGDTHTYSLISGTGDTDNSNFTISGSSLSINIATNHEVKDTYAILVQTNDGNGGTFSKAFTIAIGDQPEAPSGISVNPNNIDENSSSEAIVGSVVVTDEDDGDSHTIEFVSGKGDNDNNSFLISKGNLILKNGVSFESDNKLLIRLRATDDDRLSVEEQLVITINDVDEPPTNISLSNANIDENESIGTSIGAFSTTDQDIGDSFTYTFASGSGDLDNASFTIEGGFLKTATVLDFETKSSYSIRINTNDGNRGDFSKAFTIAVMDVSETPTDISLDNLSIDENKASGTSIGNFATADVDAGESYTYSLVSGTGDVDNAAFTIAGNELKSAQIFDFETKSSYTVRVNTNDGNGGDFAKSFIISVSDVSETPTDLSLSNASIDENQATGTVVGIFSTTDVDAGETYTYTLVSGSGDTDNTAFTIVGNELKSAQIFDFETKSNYTVRVNTNDGNGGDFAKSLIISVSDVSETPTDLSLSNASIDENQSTGTVVGTLSTTDVDAGETYTYTLVSGSGATDNTAFTIAGNELKSALMFDFETKSSYSIRVNTNDGNGGDFTKSFIISVSDVSETPTDLSLSNASIDENQATGTVVGTLSTTDVDAGETYTYTLVSGSGATDNAAFTIVGNELKSAQIFDFETKSSYTVRVNTNDGNGGDFAKSFTLSVSDVSETPTDLSLSNASIDENQATGTVVGTLSTTDVDAGETYTYTLVSGSGATDNAAFTIVGNELKSALMFDFETKSSYTVRVNTNDGNGGDFAKSLIISVSDVSETPTDLSLSNASIDENQATGTVVGTFSTTDVDAGETYTYTLVSGSGATDNTAFTIAGNELKSALMFDFETKSSYTVRVNTNDGNGGDFAKSLIISVSDVSETPTDLSLSNASIDENQSTGTVVGTLSTTDVDGGETYTYTLVSGSGATDNAAFTITGNELKSALMFDFETKSSYTVRVNTNDGNGGDFAKSFIINIVDDANEAIIWDGTSWSNTTGPTASDNVIIDGRYTYFGNGSFTCNDLSINAGADLYVNVEGTLIVHGDIVNNGILRILNGSSFITFSGKNVSGNDIEIRRSTRYADGKYSFVGSPVVQSAEMTASDLGEYVYTYDESQSALENDLSRWIATDAADQLIPGKGYTQANKQLLSFFGAPNTGTITYSAGYVNDGWHLVSNPYAAAILIDDFLDANLNTTGAVYIWDDNGSDTGRGDNSDYIVANKTGATDNGGIDSESRWNNHIGSAQGFFVQLGSAAGNITFTETMRKSDKNADDNFFRKSKEENSLIRLNLTDNNRLYKQAIVGWNNEVSGKEITPGYDAPIFDQKAEYAIYTMKANQALTIQTIDDAIESIDLGLNLGESGFYQLSLEVEGYIGKTLVLHDMQTKEHHDISNGTYTFQASAGSLENRFEILVINDALSVWDTSSKLYAHDKILYFESNNLATNEFQLRDLSGKELLRIANVGSEKVDLHFLPNGVYLVFDGVKIHKIVLK